MTYEDLWESIADHVRPLVIIDFVRLSATLDHFWKLGFLYGAALIHFLSDLLNLHEISVSILNRLANLTADKLNIFCSYFIMAGKSMLNLVWINCITAEPVLPRDREIILSKFELLFDVAQMHIEWSVDNNILGGLIIRINDYLFDASYLRYVNNLEQICTQYMLEGDYDVQNQ